MQDTEPKRIDALATLPPTRIWTHPPPRVQAPPETYHPLAPRHDLEVSDLPGQLLQCSSPTSHQSFKGTMTTRRDVNQPFENDYKQKSRVSYHGRYGVAPQTYLTSKYGLADAKEAIPVLLSWGFIRENLQELTPCCQGRHKRNECSYHELWCHYSLHQILTRMMFQKTKPE